MLDEHGNAAMWLNVDSSDRMGGNMTAELRLHDGTCFFDFARRRRASAVDAGDDHLSLFECSGGQTAVGASKSVTISSDS